MDIRQVRDKVVKKFKSDQRSAASLKKLEKYWTNKDLFLCHLTPFTSTQIPADSRWFRQVIIRLQCFPSPAFPIPDCDRWNVGAKEHPKSHMMAKFQQLYSDVPSSCYSIYVTSPSAQGAYRSLVGERLVLPYSHTFVSHKHLSTGVTHMLYKLTWTSNGGSFAVSAFGWPKGCGCTPLAVCVSLSAMGNTAVQEGCGQWVTWWESMCFQWRGLAMHAVMLKDLWRKFSAPLGLFMS